MRGKGRVRKHRETVISEKIIKWTSKDYPWEWNHMNVTAAEYNRRSKKMYSKTYSIKFRSNRKAIYFDEGRWRSIGRKLKEVG